jgi:hypothetical protein
MGPILFYQIQTDFFEAVLFLKEYFELLFKNNIDPNIKYH